MKFILSVLCVLCAMVISPRARADAEDIRRLNGTVEALNEGQESMRRQLQELREAVIQLRQENAQLKQQLANQGEVVTRDQLREVVKSIQIVDEKRLADADYVRKQLEEIAREVSKSLSSTPREPSRSTPPKSAPTSAAESKLPDKQYVHRVQTGETIGAIIAAYNKEYGLKVRTSDVLVANPGLKDPKRLRVGQELNIPAVK